MSLWFSDQSEKLPFSMTACSAISYLTSQF